MNKDRVYFISKILIIIILIAVYYIFIGIPEYKNSRDSIQEVIDTIFVQLDDVNTEYEAIYDTILANSVSEDYIFFTEYLKWYFTGFFSNNNADTIEAN